MWWGEDGDIAAGDLHSARDADQQVRLGGRVFSIGRQQRQARVLQRGGDGAEGSGADRDLVLADVGQIEVIAKDLEDGAMGGIEGEGEARDVRLERRRAGCKDVGGEGDLEAGIRIDGNSVLIGIAVLVAVDELNNGGREDRDVEVARAIGGHGVRLAMPWLPKVITTPGEPAVTVPLTMVGRNWEHQRCRCRDRGCRRCRR